MLIRLGFDALMGLDRSKGLDPWWGPEQPTKGAPKVGAKGSPPRAPKVGPTRAHLGGAHQAYIRKGGTIPLTLAPFAGRRPLFRASSPSCSRGSSNPECDASSRMCGHRGGAALAAQG